MSRSILRLLDSSLYPQIWQQQTFTNPQALLIAMLTAESTPDAKAFSKQLLANDVYQQWINFTVFGGYLQRNFIAFYRQTKTTLI